MQKSIAIVTIAGLAAAATAQTTIGLTGINVTDATRGLDNAEVGDVIEVSLVINHNQFSAAGAIFDILGRGVGTGDWNLAEDGTNAFSPWTIGRNPIYFSAFSDRPAGSTNPGNFTYEAVDAAGTPYAGNADSVLTTTTAGTNPSNFISLGATPPGAGGFVSVFPIDSGEASLVFRITYQGGTAELELNAAQVAVYPTSTSIGGIGLTGQDVAYAGPLLRIVPAPASAALLGLGGLAAIRRRR